MLKAAIKMLTKLVEKQTPESIHAHLGDIMPGLLKVNQYLANIRRKTTLKDFVVRPSHMMTVSALCFATIAPL